MKHLSFHRQQGGRSQTFLRGISIKSRLSLVLGTMIVLLVIAAMVFIRVMFISYESNVSLHGSTMAARVMEHIDVNLSSILTVTKYPVIQTDQRHNDTYLYLSYPDRYNKTTLYTDLDYRSTFLFEQNREIRLIAVFDLRGEGSYVRNNKKSTYRAAVSQQALAERELPQTDWFIKTLSNRGGALVWRHDEIDLPVDVDDRQNLLYVSRAVINLSTFKPVGLVVAAVDIGQSNQLFEENHRLASQRMGTFDVSGRLLWGDLSAQSIRTFLASPEYDSGAQAGSSYMTLDVQDTLYQYNQGVNGLYTLLITPGDQLIRNVFSKEALLFILLLFACVAIGFALRGIIKSIVAPVKDLADTCNLIVEREDFSITIRDENRDELSELTAAFNILTGKIEHLIYDVYEKKIELVQTQIQLLRSQVNPHFLYNTLDTIRAKALLSGQSELGDMALLLAGILRYGISAPGELVRVETEVDRLKEYLALQKHLYQNRFSENISIAPDVLDLMTIKFILQPLVENSLYHGLGAMEAPGTLEILGYRDGDRLIFQVTDNGVGITADALKELIDYMDNNNNRLTSIGLKNVHRRLRILYGNDYGVKIASQTGIGTVVTACLPIITQGDIKDEEHANDPDRR